MATCATPRSDRARFALGSSAAQTVALSNSISFSIDLPLPCSKNGLICQTRSGQFSTPASCQSDRRCTGTSDALQETLVGTESLCNHERSVKKSSQL